MSNHTEIIERLREIAERQTTAGREACLSAADLLEAGESRVEYRVAFDRNGEGDYTVTTLAYLSEAEEWAANRRGRPGFTNVRVISRTVSTTPWVDVEDGATR